MEKKFLVGGGCFRVRKKNRPVRAVRGVFAANWYTIASGD